MTNPPWLDARFLGFVQRYPNFSGQIDFASYFEDGFVIKDRVFDLLYNKIDPRKSPGSPLCFKFSSNSSISSYLTEFKMQIERRLEKLYEYGKSQDFLQLHPSQSFDLVSGDVTDPVLVAIKPEPRKVGKRPRLIKMVSVIVNSIGRLLLHDNFALEQAHGQCPTATQLDITTREATLQMFHEFRRASPLYTSDVQGWEYSVSLYDNVCAFVKNALQMGIGKVNGLDFGPVDGHERHFYTLKGYYMALCIPLLQFPSGKLYITIVGQMLSGVYQTFEDNSFVRGWLADLVSYDATGHSVSYVKTAGDDCNDSGGHHEQYAKYGFVITDTAVQTDVFNFCSTVFTEDCSYQENIWKSVYQQSTEDVFDDEKRLAFDMCFQHHPDYQLALKYLTLRGGDEVKSKHADSEEDPTSCEESPQPSW